MSVTNNTNREPAWINDQKLKIELISFAYKSKTIPHANMLFDVRFIDNPFWIDELRPLTGLDSRVQDFVLKQTATENFLLAFKGMIKMLLPAFAVTKAAKTGTASELEEIYTIAFGCTGGQHRSVVIVEEAARLVGQLFPQCSVNICHREINKGNPAGIQQKINEGSRS